MKLRPCTRLSGQKETIVGFSYVQPALTYARGIVRLIRALPGVPPQRRINAPSFSIDRHFLVLGSQST